MRISDDVLNELFDLQTDLLKNVSEDEKEQEQGFVSGPQLLEILLDLRDLREKARAVLEEWDSRLGHVLPSSYPRTMVFEHLRAALGRGEV